MKKVWIYVLAIFMLVSAFSFAGAAADVEPDVIKPLSGDSIEIPLGSAIEVVDGNVVNLDLSVSNLTATEPVDFTMEILYADNTPVNFKVNKFNVSINSLYKMSIDGLKVGGFAAVPDQDYNVPITKAISLSGQASVQEGETDAGFLISFYGTANETKTIPADAKVKFTLTNNEKISDDVYVYAGIFIDDAELKFSKLAKLDKVEPVTPVNPEATATDAVGGKSKIAPGTSSEIIGTANPKEVIVVPNAGDNKVNLTIAFVEDVSIESDGSVTGTLSKVEAVYAPIETLGGGSLEAVTLNLNLVIKDNAIPTAFPAIDTEIKEDVADLVKGKLTERNPVILSMVSADVSTMSDLDNNLKIKLTFTIPKADITLTSDTVAVYHYKTGTPEPVAIVDFDSSDVSVYKITIESDLGFSSYALAKVDAAPGPGPVDPVPTSGGGSSGSSTWATTTPTPTVTPTPTTTPTGTPTEGAPTDVPTSGQPTKPAGTPAPILGILAGLAIAGIVLRRK